MIFEHLSLPAWFAGLAAFGLVLYGLLRLRPRRKQEVVPSILLWRLAAAEAPSRFLRRRFENLTAFLLSFLIVALLWSIFGRPGEAGPLGKMRHVIVVDGSAAMGADDRMAAAKEEALKQASRFPAGSREVLWSGSQLERLLAPGADTALLAARLRGKAPEPCPQQLNHVLKLLSLEASQEIPLSVSIITVAAPKLPPPPPFVDVKVVPVGAPKIANTGIVAFGITEQPYNGRSSWDAYLETASTAQGGDRQIPRFTLDGAPVEAAMIEPLWSDAERSGFLLHDLPGTGALLRAELGAGDALAFDDHAGLRLPSSRPIRVYISPSLRDVILPILQADSGFESVEETPEVVIRKVGESAGGPAPALEFEDTGDASFVSIQHPADANATVLRSAIASMVEIVDQRLTPSDSSKADHPIAFEAIEAGQWRIRVSGDFLHRSQDVDRSRALPVLVGTFLRWMTPIQAGMEIVSAGHPWENSVDRRNPTVTSANGKSVDTAGGNYAPDMAQELQLNTGDSLWVSLLDLNSTTLQKAPPLALGDNSNESGVKLESLALAATLLLLAFEWWRYNRGKMP